jgi:hypothetical protein
MTSRHSVVAGILPLVTAAVLLSACTAQPVLPTPAPTSTTTPPTSTPEPEPVHAAGVVVSAETISVVGDDGSTLAAFDYHQPTSEVVGGLAEYLGPPADSRVEYGSETPAATLHEWGGLQLFDTDIVEKGMYWSNHWVYLVDDETSGLPLTTVGGIAVGDPLDSIDMSTADTPVDYTSPEVGRVHRSFRVDRVPLPPGEGTGDAPDIGILVTGYVDDAIVNRIEAPASNYGH